MSLDSGKRIHANRWEELPITPEVVRKVHELADSQGQPWLHDEPFTLSYLQDGNEFQVIDEGDAVAIDESGEEDVPILEPEGQLEHTETDREDTDDSVDQNEYSSGTTLEASDSTYTSNSTYTPEVSFTDEVITNGVLQDDEDDVQINESGIDSTDFTFNIANAYDTSQEILEEDCINLYEEGNESISSRSDLDVPILELHRRGDDDSSLSPSVQLFSIGETYTKAVHVMFTHS